MENYYIGLDIGTDSVGWCVTDENYNILNIRGKTACGVRLFDEASDCKTRRSFRSNKRRMNRRKYRLNLSRSLFKDEIDKIDDTFFVRLQESSYHFEDKSKGKTKFPLFDGHNKEKEFYKKYPTIYHLRLALMNDDKEAFSDLRYVYLAIHHILKKRGNFIKEGKIEFNRLDEETINNLNVSFDTLNESSNTPVIIFNQEMVDKTVEVLLNKENKNTKKKQLVDIIKYNGEENDEVIILYLKELFIPLIIGSKVNLSKLDIDDNGEKVSIEFNSKYDENLPTFESILGDKIAIVDGAKKIFDFVFVKKILGDYTSLSDAMVNNVYENFKKDLSLAKIFISFVGEILGDKKFKKNFFETYYSINKEGKGLESFVSEFKKYVAKYKDQFTEIDMYREQFDRLESGEFLKRISDVKGSEFPHQLHENELKLILDNATKYYPFIEDIKDKIMMIFKFRVPYYVGPFNDKSGFSWIKRNGYEKALPWNYKEVINLAETKQNFINRMTNNCTYIYSETVLPYSSVTYYDYINLDRLNKIRINGIAIDLKVKQHVFDNLISVNKKTNISKLIIYLREHFYNNEDIIIDGIDTKVAFESPIRAALSGSFDLTNNSVIKLLDTKILPILTVYADSPKEGLDYIKEEYKNELTDNQIAALGRITSKKWATLSYKLLRSIRSVDENGVVGLTMVEALYITNLNFQQLLYDRKYNFISIINMLNKEQFGDATKKKMIDEIIEKIPPLMRRPIIQSMKIVYEIKKLLKQEPTKVVVEVTRTNKAEKKETNSRRKEIETFLKALVKDHNFGKDAKLCQDELNNELVLEKDLNVKGTALFLYFKQLGYDLYTGEKIHINDVFDSTKYDIDHIVPQSKIKDDSLDNKVLTSRNINQNVKRNIYPLPREIRNNPKVQAIWKFLHDKGLISDKKYNNLVRIQELSEDEMNDFVSRQINVVNRSNIVLRDILNIMFNKQGEKDFVIFSKAENISFIRNYLKIVKIRELNDYHHAVDAYLNIVGGNLLHKYYFDTKLAFAMDKLKKEGKFTYNIESVLKHKFDDEELRERVISNCFRNDYLMTIREQYVDDAFYNQTVYEKGKSNELIPLHTDIKNPLSNTNKYGGYMSLARSYFIIGTSNSGEKMFFDVPVLYEKLYGHDRKLFHEKLAEYQRIDCGDIVFDFDNKIMPRTKILFKNNYYTVTPANRLQISLTNLSQILLNKEDALYLKVLYRFGEEEKLSNCNLQSISIVTNKDGDVEIISKEKNLNLYIKILEFMKSERFKSYNVSLNYFKKEALCAEDFLSLDLGKEIIVIKNAIKILNRKEGSFLLSKVQLIKNGFVSISSNITGIVVSNKKY